MSKIVVALGGNAISDPATPGTIADQFATTRETSEVLADLIDAGHQLVITHGNGPQVGNILRRVELARNEVYPIDLGLCVADSQAGMGYMICQCLGNELAKRDRPATPCTIVTAVEVERDDPAFANPSKPIGILYSTDDAERHMGQDGWIMKEVKNRGWRRVVPSPYPRRILEVDTIRRLVDAGVIVVGVGGGGIPVVWREGWGYEGVEAVIDKDLSSALLAIELGADILAIVTGEDAAYLHFGTADARRLEQMTVQEARTLQAEGHFPAGSMGPKIEAAVKFVSQASASGRRSIITSSANLVDALENKAGTRIVA